MEEKTFFTYTEAETEELGLKLARTLRAGSVLAMTGDLGTGKTCMVRGIGKGLNIQETINSPTFPLLNIYSSGSFIVNHFDAYRLNSSDELIDIGFEDYLYGSGICIIEWAERIKEYIPDDALWITFRHGGENKREITFFLAHQTGPNLI
jgi:tRNA threonylcarbamoyladenosine biosynthesis protein TsaE